MVITPEGIFNTHQDALDYCKTLLNLAELELNRANSCNEMLKKFTNTNLTIKTDQGECHIHTCRSDDDAISITALTMKAVKILRDRRMNSASDLMKRAKRCQEAVEEDMHK